MASHPGLSVVVVDGEPGPLVTALSADPRVGAVHAAAAPGDVPLLARRHRADAVFLAAEFATEFAALGPALAGLPSPPVLVYVAADGARALEAFEIGAVDYLIRPVGPDLVGRALGRVAAWRRVRPAPADDLDSVPVEVDGRTVVVRRDDVRVVEARGDYVRLHTRGGTHLVRLPLSRLAQRWAAADFVRVHRGYLVSLRHVRELREHPHGGVVARVTAGAGVVHEVPVSRRHLRPLKERLRGRG